MRNVTVFNKPYLMYKELRGESMFGLTTKKYTEMYKKLRSQLELETRKSVYWKYKALYPDQEPILIGTKEDIEYIKGGEITTLTCKNCGKEYNRDCKYDIKGTWRDKYCSVECCQEYEKRFWDKYEEALQRADIKENEMIGNPNDAVVDWSKVQIHNTDKTEKCKNISDRYIIVYDNILRKVRICDTNTNHLLFSTFDRNIDAASMINDLHSQ